MAHGELMNKQETFKHVIYWAGPLIRLAVIAREGQRVRILHREIIDTENFQLQEVVGKIKEFLQRTKTQSREWTPVVAQGRVLWKSMRVPSHDPQEIGKMVRLSMKTTLWDAEEFIFDYNVIQKQADGYSTVRIGIIAHEILKQYWDLLRDAGMKCAGWTVSSLAIKHLNDVACGSEGDAQIVLHAERQQHELSCFVDGQPVLAKTLSVNDEFAALGHVPLFVTACREQYKERNFQCSLLSTEKPTECLKDALADLPLSVDERLIPLKDFLGPNEPPPNAEGSWLPLLGAALAADPVLLQWMPSDARQVRMDRRWMQHWMGCIFLFAMACVLTGSLIGMQYFRKTAVLKELTHQAQVLRQQMGHMEEMTKHLDGIHAQLDQRVFVADILERLDQLREPSVYFNRIEWIKRDGLVLQGIAADEGQVNNFQKQLIASHLFENVALQYAQRKEQGQGVYFKIHCGWRKGRP
jgi:Tfp pilus assembly protein PilN